MKRKILKVVILAMTAMIAASSLFGCAGTKLSNTYLKEDRYNTPVYDSAVKIDGLEGYTYGRGSSDLHVLTKYDQNYNLKTAVYNLKTNAIVYEVTNDAATAHNVIIDSVRIGNEVIEYFYDKTISVTTGTSSVVTTYTAALYNANGTLQTSATSNSREITVTESCDLIGVDGSFYRVDKEGVFTFAFERGLADIPVEKFEEKSDKYYYFSEDNNGVTTIYVYDLNGNAVSSYVIPSYAEEFDYMVLENGKILLQYVVMLDAYASDYDFLEENSFGVYDKYNLEKKLINPRTGKAKNVKDNVIITDFLSGEDIEYYQGVTSDLKNLAYGYAIVDGYVDFDEKVFKISNFGKATELEDPVPGFESAYYAFNHYFVQTELDQVLLFSERSKFVGDITNAKVMTEKYIATENAIYDYELNMVFDIKANKYQLVGGLLNDVILKDSDGFVYAYDVGVVKLTDLNKAFLADELTQDGQPGWYYAIFDGVQYNYYNTNKALITTTTVAAILKGSTRDNKAALLQSGTSFIRFSETIVTK